MPTSSVKLTFLPWIVDEHKNKHEKQLQISKRHQHTALAGHQRQREQGKRLRRSKSCLTSSVSPDQSSRSTTNGLRNVTRWSSPMADDNGFIEPRAGVLPSPTLMSASFSGMNLFDEVQLSGEFKRHLDDGKTKFRLVKLLLIQADSPNPPVACICSGLDRRCGDENSRIGFSNRRHIATYAVRDGVRWRMLPLLFQCYQNLRRRLAPTSSETASVEVSSESRAGV